MLISAFLVVNHPRRSPILYDIISPAERLLAELDRWGNLTMTASFRSAIRDLLPVSSEVEDADTSPYRDILDDSRNVGFKRPVLCLPGYITSGLEMWDSLPCAQARFRDRIWGTTSMIKLFLTDSKCWMDHMRLVPTIRRDRGGNEALHFVDPVGVRIKPVSGLGAADFVIGDYWVWNPIIEALGRAGFDESRLWMMSYDWRLPLRDLQVKDRLFTRMALEIEKLVKLNKERILFITHSFGAKVWFFFINWVQEHLGPLWLDQHIHTTYHVAPVFLGVPKSISSTLSGDTRDTAQLGAMSTLLDTLLPPADRTNLTATWGSLVDMLPQGGLDVWGEGPFLVLNKNESLNVIDSISLLLRAPHMRPHAIHRSASPTQLRCPPTKGDSICCYKDAWTDPTITPLPRTKMRIWCSYGIGVQTEVGYHFVFHNNNGMFRLDTSHHDGPTLTHGVFLDDGDGTVPIESLGGMCVQGWREGSTLNPQSVEVSVRELPHGGSYSVMSRGSSVGGSSVDHVDIMGNRQILRDILYLALGMEDSMDPATKDLKVLNKSISIGG